MNKDNWMMPPNEWQFVDPSNGFIFPWYTMGFLEELQRFEMKDWSVFEAGGGSSSLWWAKKCRKVITVDCDLKWIARIKEFAGKKGLTNIEYIYVEPVSEGVPHELVVDFRERYIKTLSRQTEIFDVVIADGSFRDKIVMLADKHLKSGGLIIADNYNQPGIWDSHLCSGYLNPLYPIKVYKTQPIVPETHPWVWEGNMCHFNKIRKGHPDWQTAYWKVT